MKRSTAKKVRKNTTNMNSVISNYRRHLKLIQTGAIIMGTEMRAISSLEAVPIFWDNFTHLKTNCAIMLDSMKWAPHKIL